nr:twin-arginine translocation signal domain-containing protein [Halorussus sp. MSC15.2]
MSERNPTRRRFLQLSGATVAASALGASSAAAESASWESVKSPVDVTLYDVEKTARNNFAVGGSGIVVERTDEGWKKVLDGGPTGNGNSLFGADVTDDGKRLWFVGSSGAIGEYDVETGNLQSHSAPNDATNNFNDVAVTGNAGAANVYVAGDSGNVFYSFENGASGTWNYVTVGQGAAIRAIDFFGARKGHLVNGNGKVFYTGDGTTWNRIGIADADVSMYGIDSDAKDDVWVVGGSGVVYHYTLDAEGTPKWFRTKVGKPGLRDVEIENGAGYAVGNSGAVFDRESGEWTRDATPAGQNLRAVVEQENNDIAVGNSGTIYETNPSASADPGSGGGGQDGDAGRIARASTETSGSKSLTFTLENVGDQSVSIDQFALETDVQVETIARSGAEVELAGDAVGTADSTDGFPVDGTLRALDTSAVYDAGTTGQADFGLYDGGNVALTVEPVQDKPSGNYLSATLVYGDGTQETFHFKVTNVNS